jgi:hypothetical protein
MGSRAVTIGGDNRSDAFAFGLVDGNERSLPAHGEAGDGLQAASTPVIVMAIPTTGVGARFRGKFPR